MTNMAGIRVLGALLLGTLVLACQAEGGGTHAAAQHPAHPTATAVTATKAAARTPPAIPVPPGPGGGLPISKTPLLCRF